jgi:hypothetical protein
MTGEVFIEIPQTRKMIASFGRVAHSRCSFHEDTIVSSATPSAACLIVIDDAYLHAEL